MARETESRPCCQMPISSNGQFIHLYYSTVLFPFGPVIQKLAARQVLFKTTTYAGRVLSLNWTSFLFFFFFKLFSQLESQYHWRQSYCKVPKNPQFLTQHSKYIQNKWLLIWWTSTKVGQYFSVLCISCLKTNLWFL